jgi:uncharacterized membrane protein YagU involved in acid resistance
MSDIAGDMLLGATAGFVATAPMTAFMEGARLLLPPEDRRPLPPQEVAEGMMEAAGVRDELNAPQRVGLSLAAHFGFGASAGAVFGALAPHLPLPRVAAGIAYGLGVWAFSYLGWLPATGLQPPGAREHSSRHALLIGAHVVWGAVLGSIAGASDGRA